MPPHEWKWKELTVHTAKCDRCDKHNESTMFRCDSCTLQICAQCEKAEPPEGHQHALSTRRRTGRRPLPSVPTTTSPELLENSSPPPKRRRLSSFVGIDENEHSGRLARQQETRQETNLGARPTLPAPTAGRRREIQTTLNSDSEVDAILRQRLSKTRGKQTVVLDDDDGDGDEFVQTTNARRAKKGKAPLYQNISIRKTRSVAKAISEIEGVGDLLLHEASRSASRKLQVTPIPEVDSPRGPSSPDDNGISALLRAANMLENSKQPTPASFTATHNRRTDDEQDTRPRSPLFLPANWEESGLVIATPSVERPDSAVGSMAASEANGRTIEQGNSTGVTTFSFPFELVDIRYASERKNNSPTSQRLRDVYRDALRARLPNGKLVRLRI